MGHSITILACADAHKDQFLAAAGLSETGVADPDHDAPYSCASNGTNFFVWQFLSEGKLFARPDFKLISKAAPLYHLEVVESVNGSSTARYEDGQRTWWISGGMTGYAAIGPPPFSKEDLIAGYKAYAAAMTPPSSEEPESFDLAVQAFVDATGFRYDQDHDLPFWALEGQLPYAKPWWRFW